MLALESESNLAEKSKGFGFFAFFHFKSFPSSVVSLLSSRDTFNGNTPVLSIGIFFTSNGGGLKFLTPASQTPTSCLTVIYNAPTINKYNYINNINIYL